MCVTFLSNNAVSAQVNSTSTSGSDVFFNAFEACRGMVQPERRLRCFDELPTFEMLQKRTPPTFSGKRTVDTNPFYLSSPTLLRYQSDGVIFVLGIQNEHGVTIKNLHIGGGGEDTYLIEEPGVYSLAINGSDTWKIWLTPDTQ